MKEIPTVKFKEKIKKHCKNIPYDLGIDFFCLCIIDVLSNKKYFLSNMPEWAKEYHKIGGARCDEVFCPETYTETFLIPSDLEYDFVQEQLVGKEEKIYGHYDTYSIIRRTENFTFIILALHNENKEDKLNIYQKTLPLLEKFIVNFILNMKEEIEESCEFILNNSYIFNVDFLNRAINTDWIRDNKFTKSEINIIKKLRNHRMLKEISYDLGISVSTCRNHLQNIKNKMGVYSFDQCRKLSFCIHDSHI